MNIYNNKQSQTSSIVKNLMVIPITITKGIKATHIVPVNAVPQVKVLPGTLEKLDEMHSIQWTRMTVERRRKVLFQQLDLSGLEGGLMKIKWLPMPC